MVTYFSLRTEYKTIALYTKISFVIFKKILETWDKHKQSCSYWRNNSWSFILEKTEGTAVGWVQGWPLRKNGMENRRGRKPGDKVVQVTKDLLRDKGRNENLSTCKLFRPVFFKGVETSPRKDVGWYPVVWKKILTCYFPFFQLFVLVDWTVSYQHVYSSPKAWYLCLWLYLDRRSLHMWWSLYEVILD